MILFRYTGNQLAVVEVTDNALSHQDMQNMAREFNFSETVFLDRRDTSRPPRAHIFTPVNEMDFAGHPVIGTGHVLFRQLLPGSSGPETTIASIETKAGTVGISYDQGSGTVAAEVPHNVHIHSNETTRQNVLDTQPELTASTAVASMKDTYPTVSVVRGVTYVLVDFTDLPDLFANVSAGNGPATSLDDKWSPSFVGTMYYRALETHAEQGTKVQSLRVRMIAIGLEDPACGSGCCTLSAYLALRDGQKNGKYKFHYDQGSEIGRDSKLTVEIALDEQGTKVSSMRLSGQAAPVTEGTILLPQ